MKLEIKKWKSGKSKIKEKNCVLMFSFFFLCSHTLPQAKRLLSAFPPDTRLGDGSLFWQSPKRPPTPLVFDSANALHLEFVVACARLLAQLYRVEVQVSE